MCEELQSGPEASSLEHSGMRAIGKERGSTDVLESARFEGNGC